MESRNKGSSELIRLVAVITVILLTAAASIAFHLVENISIFLRNSGGIQSVEWLLNVLFLTGAIALWISYRLWRMAADRRDELNNIIESINPDVLLVVAPDRTILMCNGSIRSMFGYSPQEVLNRKLDVFFTNGESQDATSERAQRLLARGTFHVENVVGYRMGGAPIYLEVISSRMVGGMGSVVLMRDITEREYAREKLAKSEAGFSNLVRMNADGMVIIQNGFVVMANPAAEAMLKTRSGGPVGHTFDTRIRPMQEMEIEVEPPNGRKRTVSVRAVTISWQGAPALLASLRETRTPRIAAPPEPAGPKRPPPIIDTTGASPEKAPYGTPEETAGRKAFPLSSLVDGLLPETSAKTMEKGLNLRVNIPRSDIRVTGNPEDLISVIRAVLANSLGNTSFGFIDVVVTGKTDRGECTVTDTGTPVAESDLAVFLQEATEKGEVAAGVRPRDKVLVEARKTMESMGGILRVESIFGSQTRFVIALPRTK